MNRLVPDACWKTEIPANHLRQTDASSSCDTLTPDGVECHVSRKPHLQLALLWRPHGKDHVRQQQFVPRTVASLIYTSRWCALLKHPIKSTFAASLSQLSFGYHLRRSMTPYKTQITKCMRVCPSANVYRTKRWCIITNIAGLDEW